MLELREDNFVEQESCPDILNYNIRIVLHERPNLSF